MSRALTILPAALSGEIAAPPSKSCAHRAVIAAALAKGRSRVNGLEMSEDIAATLGAVCALGASVELLPQATGKHDAVITGIDRHAEPPAIDCRESGSTLRFMLPVALASAGGAAFTGSLRLGQRPLGPYIDIFKAQGIAYEHGPQGFPLTVRGELKPDVFHVPGNISSQFITGLMLALPLLKGDSLIAVEGELESLPYVDITVSVLARFGVHVEEQERGRIYRVPAQEYRPAEYTVEGDWSQAASLLLMGLLGGPVSIGGLDSGSAQGDKVIEKIFRDMGGDIRWESNRLVARRSKLYPITADVSQCPDLAPAIAAAMAVAQGESRITGGARLRVKESDRLQSIASCLGALGAEVVETGGGLVIQGRPKLRGGSAAACNDHRIAMMAAAVSPACEDNVILDGWEAVAKSWPGFWDEFRGLGGRIDG